MWSSTWCMTAEWSLAWPRLAPESRAFWCPSPSLPGKTAQVWNRLSPLMHDGNERPVLPGNKLALHPQVGVHAWTCQRFPRGRHAGCAAKPQGVGVITAFTVVNVSMDQTCFKKSRSLKDVTRFLSAEVNAFFTSIICIALKFFFNDVATPLLSRLLRSFKPALSTITIRLHYCS